MAATAKSQTSDSAYAIIKTGGKQYRVQAGQTLDVELCGVESGKKATFEDVLLHSDGGTITSGTPTISGATVTAEVVGEVRADKVTAFKYRRRKGYHRTVGHRQRLTRVKIDQISL
jgi:large subunit ribosomal protein L21